MGGVFPNMGCVGVALSWISRKHLWVVPALERCPDAREARSVRRCHYQEAVVRENTPALEEHVHWIMQKVLDEFATENEIECRVGIRKHMRFCVEQVDLCCERLSPFYGQRLRFTADRG